MFCGCRAEKISIDKSRYEVIERIADGGFAEIDLVEDDKGKLFALKRQLCFSEEEQQKALREVDYYQKFDHCNIVKCTGHTVNQSSKRAKAKRQMMIGRDELNCEVCMLFPYYRRGCLQNAIELMKLAKENWSDSKLLSMFRGVCAGIEVIHSQSPVLAHADLKPANILLTADDVPVLTDFGSMRTARIMVQDKRTARIVQDEAAQHCSMLFRPPELFDVASDAVLDERVDIWSLGCVLYAMCYHESPFERAYSRGDSLALATLNARITYPSTPSYSPLVRELIELMLVSDPSRRPFIDTVIERVDSALRNLSKLPETGEDVELFVRTKPPNGSSYKKHASSANASNNANPESIVIDNERLALRNLDGNDSAKTASKKIDDATQGNNPLPVQLNVVLPAD